MSRPSRLITIAGLLLVAFLVSGSATNPVDIQLPQLKNKDPEVRVEALRQLLTSLDSRIPEAMLPLLSDEGNSIRRLAGRAIGSRWWQIPKGKSEGYVNALQQNLKTEPDFEDEKNMAERAIGLLRKNYDSKMFSRSPNKRWVIYERRGLPCLIDTTTYTEELLGWPRTENGGAEMLVSSWGNGPFSDDVIWHPTKEAVALSVLENRRETTVWVWQHKFGLQKLSEGRITKLVRENGRKAPASIDTTIKGWKGNDLLVSVEWGWEPVRSAVIAWDLDTHAWRVISQN